MSAIQVRRCRRHDEALGIVAKAVATMPVDESELLVMLSDAGFTKGELLGIAPWPIGYREWPIERFVAMWVQHPSITTVISTR